MSSIKGLGYHLKPIPKGRLGHISKIQEELMEYEDAIEQNCRIMAMVELSDLVGAIDEIDIGEWDDDHPLNSYETDTEAYFQERIKKDETT